MAAHISGLIANLRRIDETPSQFPPRCEREDVLKNWIHLTAIRETVKTSDEIVHPCRGKVQTDTFPENALRDSLVFNSASATTFSPPQRPGGLISSVPPQRARGRAQIFHLCISLPPSALSVCVGSPEASDLRTHEKICSVFQRVPFSPPEFVLRDFKI